MKNDRTKIIFYLDLKHVHKYGCAKFQPNPLFSSQQTATEGATEKKKPTWRKKKKKSRQPLKGIPSVDGMPQSICYNGFPGLVTDKYHAWRNTEHLI